MKSTISLITLTLMFVASFAQNPFLVKQWSTPHEVPPFNLIKTEHFMPAINEGIKTHTTEIQQIIQNKQAPTFANTIEALENSGQSLYRVITILGVYTSSNTSDGIQEVDKESSPLLSEHYDGIYMNDLLFTRVKAVYEKRASLKLQGEQAKLLEETYKRFVRNGALLPEAKKSRMKEINSKISVLNVQFGENLLKATNGYYMTIEKESDLSGLPAVLVESASSFAKKKGLENKWAFGLSKTTVMPFITYADNRVLRKQLYEYYLNRCNGGKYDNNPVIAEIVALRAEKAKLMGFPDYASYVLDDNMAKTPSNVDKLLSQLWKPALAMAKQEESDIQEMIIREGGSFKVQPWDWFYYTEKIRLARYDLNEEEMKPYFPVDSVRKGVFYASGKLFGLTFKKRTDLPVYNNKVETYEVYEANGMLAGILYVDYYAGTAKRSGAWMNNYRDQKKVNGKDVRPIISINFNYPAPAEGETTLLTWEEVSTFFHEFGHALHGMLTRCTYASLSGTAVPRDFVELPSQIMENWANEPELLKVYAKHYKTGEVIPASLVTKMKNAEKFNMGFVTTEYLAAALLDMKYHSLEFQNNIEPQLFEQVEMDKLGLIDAIPARYKSTFFQHVFAGGYSAGYYAYIWAEVLDADAYSYFRKYGVFDKATADSFRKNILEKGGTEDAMKLYRQFTGGKDPQVQPLIDRRGLN
ncbi:MAG: M3 family metallopeptidase [Bacteroidales bacterium]|nr:M3 family metallopeptidase [Bacteroidales bacterium]